MASKKQNLSNADLKRVEDQHKKNATDKVALNQMRKEIKAEKKKLAGEWKRLKHSKKYKHMEESGQLIDENRLLRKELKNLQGHKGSSKCEDMRMKNLMRENKALKRQKELLECDFEKMKRYYLERCLKSLISNVVRIKQYRHNNGKVCLKNKVNIEVRGGGQFVIDDVQIEELDADDGDDECRNKTTKAFFAQIEQDIENDRASWPCGDDAEHKELVSSSDDSDSDADNTFAGDVDGELLTDSVSVAGWMDNGAMAVHLQKELDGRTDDVSALMEMVSGAPYHTEAQTTVEHLVSAMEQRGQDLIDELENKVCAKPQDVEEVRDCIERWNTCFSTLAKVVDNQDSLFNGKLAIYDWYLNELKGRLSDIDDVHKSSHDAALLSGVWQDVEDRHAAMVEQFEALSPREQEAWIEFGAETLRSNNEAWLKRLKRIGAKNARSARWAPRDSQLVYTESEDGHICWDFNTLEGCRWGANCYWSHHYLDNEAIHPQTGEKMLGPRERSQVDAARSGRPCFHDNGLWRRW